LFAYLINYVPQHPTSLCMLTGLLDLVSRTLCQSQRRYYCSH